MKKLENLQNYTTEKLKDAALLDIKQTCMKYLHNKNLISKISDEEIVICYDMILNEYNAISDLKKGLKVRTYFSPFYEIYSNLDNMIMKDHLLQKEEKITFLELTKEINYLEDILAFCYGVLHKIIEERKILL